MSSIMFKKLNRTLINDKKINTYELSKVLCGEFTKILQEYAEVLPDSNINFDINEKGEYVLSFTAKLKRVKTFGFFK